MKKALSVMTLVCFLALMITSVVSAESNDGKSPATAITISETDKKYEWTITNKLWSDDGKPLGQFDDKYYQVTPLETAVFRIIGKPSLYDCYIELCVMNPNNELETVKVKGTEVPQSNGSVDYILETELQAGKTYYLRLSSMESGSGYITVTGGSLQTIGRQPVPSNVITAKIGLAGYSLNGMTKDMAACYYKGEDTMMPVRMLEEFGVSFDWDEASQTAEMSYGNTSVQLTIGSTDSMINGVKTPIVGASGALVAPEVTSGRTMIPLRFVSQKLGFKVQWDPSDLITIGN